MGDEYVESVSNRYIELYENITGDVLEKGDLTEIHSRIEVMFLITYLIYK